MPVLFLFLGSGAQCRQVLRCIWLPWSRIRRYGAKQDQQNSCEHFEPALNLSSLFDIANARDTLTRHMVTSIHFLYGPRAAGTFLRCFFDQLFTCFFLSLLDSAIRPVFSVSRCEYMTKKNSIPIIELCTSLSFVPLNLVYDTVTRFTGNTPKLRCQVPLMHLARFTTFRYAPAETRYCFQHRFRVQLIVAARL